MGAKVTGDLKAERAVLLKLIEAPSATSGYGTLYMKDSDSKMYYKDGSGNEHEVGGGEAPAIYDRDTLILLPFTGTDGQARNIKDSSLYNHTVIVQGNAQIDTAQYKYGDSSLLLDGTGDMVYLPQHGKFQLGYDDFTIEAWVRLATDINTSVADARWICASGRLENYVGTWCFGYGYNSGWGAGKRLNFTCRPGGYVAVTSDASTIDKDTWYHMACVRYSGTIKLYLDGTCINGSGTSCTELLYDKGYGTDRAMTIGARGNLSNGCFECQNGWMADFRLSHCARYTADFTPPAAFLSPYL